jgi:protocatechuate 3,4-dioxygenase beta subunit
MIGAVIAVALTLGGAQQEPARTAQADGQSRPALPPSTLPAPFADLPFHGRVVARATGAPIEGAVVLPPGEGLPRTTGADGRFELLVLSGGLQNATVHAAGYGAAALRLVPGHERADRALRVELLAGATLRLRVLEPDGRPAEGLRAELSGSTANTWPPGAWLVEGNGSERDAARVEDGVAVFEDVAPGSALSVLVRAPGPGSSRGPCWRGATGPVVLAPGEVREVLLRLPERYPVAGRLVDEGGAPLAGERVWVVRRGAPAEPRLLSSGVTPFATARTDDDGRFRFDAVPAGSWWVGLAPPGVPLEAGARVSLAQAVALEGPLEELELRAAPGASLRGRVVDPTGGPVEGAFVQADAARTFDRAPTTTDADGRFALHALLAGEVEVEVQPPWYRWDGLGRASLRLEAGARELTLRLPGPGSLAHVALRFDPPLDRRTGSWIRLQPCAPAAARRPVAFTRGPALLRALEPGCYDVYASTDDGRVGVLRDVELTAGGECRELLLPTQAGAVLRLRYAGPLPRARLELDAAGLEVPCGPELVPGVESAQLVPPGPVRARLYDLTGALLDERELIVRGGETTVLELGR